jgi:hypothetical protein
MGYYITMPDGSQQWVDGGMIIGGSSVNDEVKQKALDDIKFIFSNYTQDGNTINTSLLDAGNESGLFINGDMPILPVLTESEFVESTPWENVAVDIASSSNTEKKGLSARLKENSDTLNQRFETQNKLIESQLKLQVESNKIMAQHVEELKKQNKIQQAQLNAKVISNTDNQSYIAHANRANASQVHKNSFELFGNPSVTDSDGKQIIPAVAKAQKDAEKAIETKAMNTTGFDLSDIEDMFDSFDVNPFSELINSLKEDIKKEHETMFPKEVSEVTT